MSAIFTGPMLSDRIRAKLRVARAFLLGMSFAAFGFVSFIALTRDERAVPSHAAPVSSAVETSGQASAEALDAARKVQTPRRIYPVTLPQEAAETSARRDASAPSARSSSGSTEAASDIVPLPRPRPSEAPQHATRADASPAVSDAVREPSVFSLTPGASSARTERTVPELDGARKGDDPPSAAREPTPEAGEPAAANAEARRKAERERSAQRARQRARRERRLARERQRAEEYYQYARPFWDSPYAYVTPDGRRAQFDRGYAAGRRIIVPPPGSFPY